MTRITCLCSWLIMAILFRTPLILAQQTNEECFREHIRFREDNNLDSLSRDLLAMIGTKDFYMIGEAHTFLANNHLQWSLIKALYEQGVYNVVNELPHATCFLFNRFLESGDTAILRQLKPVAQYEILEQVRAFNLRHAGRPQVRYFGVDYLDARYDFSNYQLSLRLITTALEGQYFHLDTILTAFINKEVLTASDVKAFNSVLALALEKNESAARAHYGVYFNDLQLMASNMVGYRSNRDERIYKSFLLLHRHLAENSEVRPRYLAFYGVGHLGNLGNKLQYRPASPVYGSMARVGIKYFNCIGGWREPKVMDEGVFSISRVQLPLLKDYCSRSSWTVGLLAPVSCLTLRYREQLDALIIFNAYGDRSMRSWKFD